MFRRITNKIKRLTASHKEKLEVDFSKKEAEKLLNSYKKYDQVRLHFGCGPRVLKNWINIDLSFEPFEQYLDSYTDEFYGENIRGNKNDFFGINILKTGLPLPDDSVDLIFHEDFLEHLTQKEQIIFLAETLRVLKPGSIHRVNTPNLLASMTEHSDFKKGKVGVYEGEWDKHIHKNVLTQNNLTEIAKMVGYNKILFNSRDNSTSKEIPKEYRPGKDRDEEDGNIFADLIK